MSATIRRATLAGATLLLVGLVGAGLGIMATSTGGAASTPAAVAQSADQPSATTAGDATLAAMVEQAVDPSVAPDAAGTAQPGLARIRARLGRWRALVHATVTLNLPNAGLQMFQVDHGKISSVGASTVTLAEAGGSTVTVTTTGSTRVRNDGQKAQLSSLAVGDDAVVFSRTSGGSATALVIVVPRVAAAAAPAASPAPQAPTN